MQQSEAEKRELSVLRTKLNKPALSSDWIARLHLVKRMSDGLKLQLITVIAPAGFGKSTLLAEWLSQPSTPASAWLSLDERDNDPFTFLNYITAAIQTVAPDACTRTRALLLATPPAEMDDLILSLLIDLEALPKDLILVLDDYHVIHSLENNEIIDALIHRKPGHFHLVVSSRHNLPLALSRIRASGQMTEIRAIHLRFDTCEAHAFLNHVLPVSPRESTVQLIEERTEGWPAGLRMAAISLQDARDDTSFLTGLQDMRQHVTAYLMDEVLARQEPATRDFLLRTSVLEQMCAPLCDALCDTPGDSQKMLAQLEAANLFIVLLDREQGWYRYHHLFGTTLLHYLRTSLSTDVEKALRLKAAVWLEQQGYLEEATQQALAAEDVATAARIVERHVHPLLNRRAWRRLKQLMRMLPSEWVEQRATLIVATLMLMPFDDSTRNIMQLIDQAESLLDANADGLTDAEVNALRGDLAAMLANLHGGHQLDIAQGIEQGRRALALVPPEHSQSLSRAVNYLSFMLQATGQREEALQVIDQTLSRITDPWTRVAIMRSWNYLQLHEGNLQQAFDTSALVHKQALACGDLVVAMQMQCVIMNVHYERNEMSLVEAVFAEFPRDAEWLHPYTLREALRCVALAQAAQGKRHQAERTAQQLLELAFEYGDAVPVAVARSLQAHVKFLCGEMPEWGIAQGYYHSEILAWLYVEVPALTRALISIRTGKPDTVTHTIGQLEEYLSYTRNTHNRRREIHVLILLALAHAAQKNLVAALDFAWQAIELNRNCGLVRPFVEAGPDMTHLLRELAKRSPRDAGLSRLLDAFKQAPAKPPMPQLIAHEDMFVESLTAREMEVLELLAQRYSNKEIAEMLSISVMTVKSHIYKIYSKLSVNSRRKAVARAQTIGILPEPAPLR